MHMLRSSSELTILYEIGNLTFVHSTLGTLSSYNLVRITQFCALYFKDFIISALVLVLCQLRKTHFKYLINENVEVKSECFLCTKFCNFFGLI